MKIYGIKTCGSVRKALKFFKDNNIEYEFIDLKKEPVGKEKIVSWLKKVSIDTLFNKMMWLHLFILRTFSNSEIKYQYE